MQSRLRLHLATPALLGILLAILANISPYVTSAQSGAPLPKPWNDAVAQLGDKIAAVTSPSTPVTFEAKNISSLDASAANAVELALEHELQRHSFRLASADSAVDQTAIQLRLTLSESADQFIWAVQILNNPTDPKSSSAAIVAVLKTDLATGETDEPSLSLEKRLVWKQPEKFLDFALLKSSASGDPELLILETTKLALYKMSGSQRQISRTNPIPQAASLSRDPQGKINLQDRYVLIADQKCIGDPDLSGNLHCGESKPYPAIIDYTSVPGLPATVTTPVFGTCGTNKMIFLATGVGDWTASDSIQGYLGAALHEPTVASGSPMDFEGPVMSLQSEPDTSAARTIIHNLKTGNYEAYIVTATCSQ
jgi:hypothetical protein